MRLNPLHRPAPTTKAFSKAPPSITQRMACYAQQIEKLPVPGQLRSSGQYPYPFYVLRQGKRYVAAMDAASASKCQRRLDRARVLVATPDRVPQVVPLIKENSDKPVLC